MAGSSSCRRPGFERAPEPTPGLVLPPSQPQVPDGEVEIDADPLWCSPDRKMIAGKACGDRGMAMAHGFRPEHLARIMGGLAFVFTFGLLGEFALLVIALFVFMGVAVACYCAVAASVAAVHRTVRRMGSPPADRPRTLGPAGRALAPPEVPGRALAPSVRPDRQLPPGPTLRRRLGALRPAAGC